MVRGDRDQDTICAVSTPHGVGGVSIIRVSGKRALEIVSLFSSFLPVSPVSHHVYFGLLKNRFGHAIDEVLVTFFKDGRSFTGEEVVEISCHGSPIICQAILNELISCGARAADRGEFTYRAFMNNKLDLVQAESVLALIESQTNQAAKLALRQLKGSVSKILEVIENDMTWVLALAEVGIDFSGEGVQVVNWSDVSVRLEKAENALTELVRTYNKGRVLKDGFRIAFVGQPNVGKSSLLNLFLEDDRAIVTDIPGTTRDVVDGDTHHAGIKFTFLDTAGLRDSTDIVEKLGIERSLEAVKEADAAFFVFDLEKGLSVDELDILGGLDPKTTYIIGNKLDRMASGFGYENVKDLVTKSKFFANCREKESFYKSHLFFVSAHDKMVRSLILDELVKELGDLQSENTVLISNTRHLENLTKALENTRRAKEVVKAEMGEEFLAIELKEALIAIHETLGKRFDDQIMDRVFKEFCIGK